MLQYPKFQHSVNLTSPDRPAHRVRGQYLARAHLSRRQTKAALPSPRDDLNDDVPF